MGTSIKRFFLALLGLGGLADEIDAADPAELARRSEPRHLKAYELQFEQLRQLSTFALAGIGGVLTLAGSLLADRADMTRLGAAVVLLILVIVLNAHAQDRILRELRGSAKRQSGRVTAYYYLGLMLMGAAIGAVAMHIARVI